jgi:hypothetical protein
MGALKLIHEFIKNRYQELGLLRESIQVASKSVNLRSKRRPNSTFNYWISSRINLSWGSMAPRDLWKQV